MIAPAIYTGTIRHRRHYPQPHAFTYSLFMWLLDIDRLAEAMRASCWTSFNRFNWASFDERDHLGEAGATLRDRLQASARSAGHDLPDGAVFLLTHLRYLGYVFNPISIYYCHDRFGALRLVMADVRNTYGGRHQYWLRPAGAVGPRFRSLVPKSLFVSPFMQGEMDYEFVLTPPHDLLVAHMNVDRRDDGRRMFDATLQLTRRPWTAASILRALLGYPLMTLRVIGAIHWEAIRLRSKGLPARAPGSAP